MILPTRCCTSVSYTHLAKAAPAKKTAAKPAAKKAPAKKTTKAEPKEEKNDAAFFDVDWIHFEK